MMPSIKMEWLSKAAIIILHTQAYMIQFANGLL